MLFLCCFAGISTKVPFDRAWSWTGMSSVHSLIEIIVWVASPCCPLRDRENPFTIQPVIYLYMFYTTKNLVEKHAGKEPLRLCEKIPVTGIQPDSKDTVASHLPPSHLNKQDRSIPNNFPLWHSLFIELQELYGSLCAYAHPAKCCFLRVTIMDYK